MKAKPYNPTKRTLYYYLKIAKRHKGLLVLNLTVPIIAIGVGDIGFRYYVAVLFEQLANYQNLPLAMLWRTFFLLMILVGTQVVFWRINDYTLLKRQARTLRDLERYVFSKMQLHSYRFYSDHFAGSLVTQFSRFLKSYELIEDTFFFELFSATIFLAFAIGVLLVTAPVLGFALLIWAVLFIGMITWHKYLEQHPDAIVLDARNDYESDIGTFKTKNVVRPKIKNFRDIKPELDKLPKDQPILTYCTGDIRCEYLSAYMKHKGFPEVYHLDGGIAKYGEEFGDDGLWEGKLYVFDKRMKVSFSDKSKDIGECVHCQRKTSRHINCEDVSCNRLVLVCNDCSSKTAHCEVHANLAVN